MRLFHFSDDPAIAVFEPRPVRTPAKRPAGQEWLNGPLVWAIDDAHSFLYFFPRECPRIVIWPTERTTLADRARWIGATSAHSVAFIEARWMERLEATTLYRYDLPLSPFASIDDVGMWVSRQAVIPLGVEAMRGLPAHLVEARVELRPVEYLLPLKAVWGSTLHASGIRLRNALA